MLDDLPQLAASAFDAVIDLRRTLHAHPELSFEEYRTTRLLRDRFATLGLTALPCPTPTGGVYRLQGSRPGPTVLVRADIDALPVQEPSGKARSWSSAVDGVMHACGHDAHAAMAVGVAEILTRRSEMLAGEVVFVMQPGEEAVAGAKRMIEGGLLDAVRPDVVLGAHIASVLPANHVAVRAGVALAGVDVFSIDVTGTGGHAAINSAAANPLTAAGRLAVDLVNLLGDMECEGATCTASLGSMSGGSAFNIVPSSVRLAGSLRTFSPRQREDAKMRLTELCTRMADQEGVGVELGFGASASPVRNDPRATSRVGLAIADAIGAASVLAPPPVSAGDDVAEFLERVPGCFILVGAAPVGDAVPHHSPQFDIDEGSMLTGLIAMTSAVLALSADGGTP